MDVANEQVQDLKVKHRETAKRLEEAEALMQEERAAHNA